jgi:hypothetical protein
MDIPPKKLSIVGANVQMSNSDGSIIGQIVKYDRKNNIAKIQLYEAIDETSLPKETQKNMFNIKYTEEL